ncbi:MAG: hypothetical protein ABRQ35_03010 [Smithellaceae bacterium]|jgi:hypothetical protein
MDKTGKQTGRLDGNASIAESMTGKATDHNYWNTLVFFKIFAAGASGYRGNIMIFRICRKAQLEFVCSSQKSKEKPFIGYLLWKQDLINISHLLT